MTTTASKTDPRWLYLLTFLITTAIISMVMAGYVAIRSLSTYHYLKEGDENHKRHTGDLYQYDPELGFAYIPGARGITEMPPGPDVVNLIDQNGFRIPASAQNDDSSAGERRPVILTLGCSFTFGAATSAEDTFPFLVGESLAGTTRNAGLSGGGLSEMLLLARKLVPVIKPDYLIVQYSPWLSERSLNMFGLSMTGKVPHPYFFGEDEPALHPPVFRAITLDLPWNRYTSTPKSGADFVSYLWNAAFPLAIHDGANLLALHTRRLFGNIPPPSSDPGKVERMAYNEIAEIGKANGAKLIMVVLGNRGEVVEVPADVGSQYLVVDANSTLIGRLPNPDRQTYIKHYAHLRGDPPRAVDFHPNPDAHRIITEEIISGIEDAISTVRGE